MTRRPGLLVSVRSADEARSAVSGGASVIDVKEPHNGPLGMADPSVWSEVRAVVPEEIPVSVALGELRDWSDRPVPSRATFEGISFRKMGLAGAASGWERRWADLLDRFGPGPGWIAVLYADWPIARSPEPDAVIRAAADLRCAGVLVDTWDKSRRPPDPDWGKLIRSIRSRVGLVALAGGWDEARIAGRRGLDPDWFAVRGAACVGGDRREAVVESRVKSLAAALTRPASDLAGPRSRAVGEEVRNSGPYQVGLE